MQTVSVDGAMVQKWVTPGTRDVSSMLSSGSSVLPFGGSDLSVGVQSPRSVRPGTMVESTRSRLVKPTSMFSADSQKSIVSEPSDATVLLVVPKSTSTSGIQILRAVLAIRHTTSLAHDRPFVNGACLATSLISRVVWGSRIVAL